MKKIVLFLALLLSPLCALAQTANTYYTAPTIVSIKALTTRPAVIQTTDSNPGVFNWGATPCSAADDIFQITPTSGPTGCYTRMATPYAVGKSALSYVSLPSFSGDQTTTINNAMSALSGAGGGTYYLPKGSTTVSATLAVPANVTLWCAGVGATVISPNSTNPGFSVISITGNKGSVQNCSINGTAIADGTRGSDGIRILDGVHNAFVFNNEVYATADNGIEDNGVYSNISFNYVHDNYTNGIYVIGNAPGAAAGGLINANVVVHNSAGTLAWDGIDLDPCHSNYSITNNQVVGNDIIIAGAYNSGNAGCGVSTGDIITGNRSYGSTENGIALLGQLTDITITNNLIDGPIGWCIYDNTNGFSSFRIVINNNYCIAPTKDGIYVANFVPSTVAMTIASPAVVTLANHNLAAGQQVSFFTTGALPTGIIAATPYYVIATGLTTNTFEVSATRGGSAINTSGSQSGVQTMVGAGGLGSVDIIGNHIENVGATFAGVRLESGTKNAAISTNVIIPNAGAYAIDTTLAADTASVVISNNNLSAGGTGTLNTLPGQTVGNGVAITVNGVSIPLGGSGTIVAAAGSIAPATTTVSPNTNPKGLFYNNAGVVNVLAPGNNGVWMTDGSGNTSNNTTLPAVNVAGVYDPRVYGAVCNGSNIATYVASAISAGATNILIPAGCTYIPPSNTLPNDVNFVGENWFTSIISVATRATDSLLMGARASINNVGIISVFCDTSVNPVSTNKVCPVGLVRNSSDTNNALTNWVGQGIFMFSGPQMTGPTGAVSTDLPMFAGVSTGPGSDVLYLAPAAANTSGVRIVPSAGGIGIFTLNGWNQVDNTLSTSANVGAWFKDYNDGLTGGQYGMRLSRIGNGTLLQLDNNDSGASASQTASFLNVVMSKSTGGNALNVFHSATTFSGNVSYMNMASGSGVFSGNFERFDVNGSQKWAIDASGNATAAGRLTGATATITGALTYGGVVLGASFTGSSGSSLVGSLSPALTTPNLGTPSALVLTNATGTPSAIGLANGTGLPLSGLSGLGTGVTTLLGGTSSGTGGPVGTASPTLTGTVTLPTLSAPSSADLAIRAGGNGNSVLIGASASPTSVFTIGVAYAYPSVNNAMSLGLSSNAWSKTWTVDASVSGVLTYGGVTLGNSFTGSSGSSLVGSISPTFTGTVTTAALTAFQASGTFLGFNVQNGAAAVTGATFFNTAGGIRAIANADGHGSLLTTGATNLALGTNSADTVTLTASQLYPNVDNAISLGIAGANRWSAINAVLGNFIGLVNLGSPSTLTCGTGCASVTGNPQKFIATSGTAQASVTVNFGITWPATPVCAIGSGSTASVVDISSISTTAITFGASVALTATPINVLCF